MYRLLLTNALDSARPGALNLEFVLMFTTVFIPFSDYDVVARDAFGGEHGIVIRYSADGAWQILAI